MGQGPEQTALSLPEELAFRAWARMNGVRDVDHPDSHYDYRGYFKNVVTKGSDQHKQYDDGPHFPDTFKQHGHPTFSNESQYSSGPLDGGRWEGETYVPQQQNLERATGMRMAPSHSLAQEDVGGGELIQELRNLYMRSLMSKFVSSKDADPGQPIAHDTSRPTDVVGSPGLARDVSTLLSAVPPLRGLVPTVRSGPDNAVFSLLRSSGFGDGDYDQTNLLGAYNRDSHEITVNPRLTSGYSNGSERFGTLAHEFGHAAGEEHGRHLNNITGLARMLQEYYARRASGLK